MFRLCASEDSGIIIFWGGWSVRVLIYLDVCMLALVAACSVWFLVRVEVAAKPCRAGPCSALAAFRHNYRNALCGAAAVRAPFTVVICGRAMNCESKIQLFPRPCFQIAWAYLTWNSFHGMLLKWCLFRLAEIPINLKWLRYKSIAACQPQFILILTGTYTHHITPVLLKEVARAHYKLHLRYEASFIKFRL